MPLTTATLQYYITTYNGLGIVSDGDQTSVVVRAPADVGDPLSVTCELSEAAGDRSALWGLPPTLA